MPAARNPENPLAHDPLLSSLRRWQADVMILGGVVLKSKLGSGGMGNVYYGLHTRLNLPVAVKVLKDRSQESFQTCLREARLTVSIDHPNLVRVYDVNTEPLSGLHYIVMECVQGCSAFAMLEASRRKNGRPLTAIAAFDIVLSAARALSAAHAKGIVHRDMKPDNILIRSVDGTVKVTDLGLAAMWDPKSANRNNEMFGTPGFISPEVVLGEAVTPAADVYALGATLFELVTGRLPFGDNNDEKYYSRQLEGKAPDPRVYATGLPAAASELIVKCLEALPANRFLDADTLAQAIQAVLAKLTGIAPAHARPFGEAVSEKMLEPDPVKSRGDGKPVVLCVDDDEGILELMSDLLKTAGFHAACFSDPEVALENLASVKPDVAVVDMQMPKMNGLMLFAKLRQSKGFEDLGVLVFSGANEPELIYTALKQGVSDYLIKPVDIREVIDRVALLCRLRNMNREKTVIETQLLKLKRGLPE